MKSYLESMTKSLFLKVKIGNDYYIIVKGKWIIVIESLTNLNYIFDVLCVSNNHQKFLSVAHIVENGLQSLI